MKSKSKKMLIWGVWLFILFAISIFYSIQATHDMRPLLLKFPHGLLVCGMPYVFFTLFYVIALTTKQLVKIPFLLIVDIVSIVLVVNNIGYFYEGPQVALNSLLVATSIIIIRILVLLFKKCPKK